MTKPDLEVRYGTASAMFAEQLCTRLNGLLCSPDVVEDIRALLENRVKATLATQEHPGITVTTDGDLGVLGLLNGVIAQGSGPYPKLCIQVDDDGAFRFGVLKAE